MNATWQDIVAISLIVTAAAYVSRRAWHSLSGKRKPGCAGCSACPQQTAEQDLIVLDPPKKN